MPSSLEPIFAIPYMSNMSISSSSQSMSGFAQRIALPRATMDIKLNHHYQSRVYSTGSPLSGEVSVTTSRDTNFDQISITLLGTVRTKADGVQSPTAASHTFLKLLMPIPESQYPVPRIFEAGRTYKFAFNFVIPNYLTINACSHRVKSDHVRDSHLLLPPTMGFWEKDDMAPEMAEVQYLVVARVIRESNMGSGHRVKLMETSHQLSVLPASVEEAPLPITRLDKQYRPSKTKTIRRSMFSSKLGKLTATAMQPGAVFLTADGRSASSTSVNVELRFDPASSDAASSSPPRLSGVTGKLEALTYYSSNAMNSFPNVGGNDDNYPFTGERRGSYTTSVSLFATAFNTGNAGSPRVDWQSHIHPQARRDSGYSSGDRSGGSGSGAAANSGSNNNNTGSSRRGSRAGKSASSGASPIFHATTLQLPVRLPTDRKQFIPTFHSCIASRVYTLRLTLSFLTPGSNASTSITLVVPLQVAVDPSIPADLAAPAPEGDLLPSFETAVSGRVQDLLPSSANASPHSSGNVQDDDEEDEDDEDDDGAEAAEADEFLRPRVLRAPAAEYVGNSVLPGYEAVANARRR